MNTRFFHKMTNVRNRVNHIGKVRRGQSVIDKAEKVKETVKYLENLYAGEKFQRQM